ncbi:MAG: PAS domain-containing protein [Nostoc sp. NMS1]|uniref:PAS domain-containing protein n=1 Tax=unclassified Nostoc TaxID=2593658 RepID=UPI0025CF6A55|nr:MULTISPECIES: PAS domain-containing protein [unclassified Nostoc]MBN3906868.1 PAS domain-containing protein [Nostoc sp. NMS1]MBN3991528.1 PAS domain-containing protein [Nostoc sp. NMS2]
MRVNAITVFFVEDSAEDRVLYRRFLERDDRYTYDIYEFESGNKALQACQGKIPDVILLDYRLPDLDGLEFVTKLQRQTSNRQISVIMLTGQGDETIAVQAIKSGVDDYLVKGKLTQENFCRTIHGAIKHKQLMQQLEQQQEQQRLVGAIALHIRKSLKLEDILTTSVQEVRQLLGADRVLVYQFTHQMQGCIVSESVLPEWKPSLGLKIEDTCFQESQGEKYRRGKIWTSPNIYEAGLSEYHIQLLEQFQVKANLVVPILVENIATPVVEWGLFVVHQCSAPRQWQAFEVELLNQLTVQLAIAIQQAQLYHNLQTLNTKLEVKVQERTAKLQESDRRFRAIFNNTFQFTGLLTPSGTLLEANQTMLSFGGLKLENVINRPFWEAHWWTISPQTQEELKQAIALAAKGKFVRYKVDVLGANNRVATIDFSLRPLLDETGKVVLLIPEGRDITEQQAALSDRKVLKRELAHKQKLLDAFINSAPVGISIVDRELRFSFINEALAEIHGIPASAHIGKTLQEILPNLTPNLEQVLEHVLTTGESILDLEITGETLKLPGVIRTWLASYFPIQSEADQPISVGIVVVEISDIYDELRLRKRAEQMLELQAVITRNIAEGVCLVRATDGVFVYTNPKFEQMFGYEPGELIGQHVSIVNYGNEHTTPEEVNQAISTVVIQNGEATYEVHNIKKDGTSFWCRANACIFDHPEYGSVLVAVQQDITEHKQAEEKIKASLKEKEVLLQEIHHRVKNNLGIVSSLLQMQCRRTQDPVVTAILRDSQNRIASIALVHEKLYCSEDLADIDFAQYIPDLITHLFDSYNVNSSQIHLDIQVDDASLDIETAIPCGLIINELVSNALKYAFVANIRGKIEVKFYQESESILTLIIRDNGIGLPENFDSKKAKTLGITLVQGLVKQLRGKLEIESHQGTQFKITFTNSRT